MAMLKSEQAKLLSKSAELEQAIKREKQRAEGGAEQVVRLSDALAREKGRADAAAQELGGLRDELAALRKGESRLAEVSAVDRERASASEGRSRRGGTSEERAVEAALEKCRTGAGSSSARSSGQILLPANSRLASKILTLRPSLWRASESPSFHRPGQAMAPARGVRMLRAGAWRRCRLFRFSRTIGVSIGTGSWLGCR